MSWITSHRTPTDTIYQERYRFRKMHWMGFREELTEAEVLFFDEQYAAADKYWEVGKVKNVVHVSKIKEGSKFFKYSIPLFTPDRQYAVIIKEIYTGNLGAGICMFLLKRKGNSWEMDRTRFKRVYCVIY